MTLDSCVEVRSAAVVLALDTTPPTLTIALADRVTPPDGAIAMVVASEDIGTSSYALVDASGHAWPLGASRLDARTEVVGVPSAGLAGGDAWLLATVTDAVGNATTQRAPTYVARPVPYDLDLSTSAAYEVEVRTDGVLDLDLDSALTLDMELSTRGG